MVLSVRFHSEQRRRFVTLRLLMLEATAAAAGSRSLEEHRRKLVIVVELFKFEYLVLGVVARCRHGVFRVQGCNDSLLRTNFLVVDEQLFDPMLCDVPRIVIEFVHGYPFDV